MLLTVKKLSEKASMKSSSISFHLFLLLSILLHEKGPLWFDTCWYYLQPLFWIENSDKFGQGKIWQHIGCMISILQILVILVIFSSPLAHKSPTIPVSDWSMIIHISAMCGCEGSNNWWNPEIRRRCKLAVSPKDTMKSQRRWPPDKLEETDLYTTHLSVAQFSEKHKYGKRTLAHSQWNTKHTQKRTYKNTQISFTGSLLCTNWGKFEPGVWGVEETQDSILLKCSHADFKITLGFCKPQKWCKWCDFSESWEWFT